MSTATESLPDADFVEESLMDTILPLLKQLELPELFKLAKAAVAEAERQSKGSAKATSTKKAGSQPKGVVPPQLQKNHAWIAFTLKHALENGWEPFTIHQEKKDKTTKEVISVEEIEMPGSILHDGAYVYEDSVTDKLPTGKQLIQKEAMSLSAQRKREGHPTWEEFESSYVAEEVVPSETSSTTSSAKKVVVKMTAAEKEAIAAAKKAQKEAEKADKKAAKEAEREAKKAEKEKEKEKKKAEKEAEKAAAKAAKEAAKKPSSKAPVPAAAVKKAIATVKAAASALTPAAPAPVKGVAPPKKAVVAAKAEQKVEEWTCPEDGMVHPWSFKGKQYLRNSDNEVWLKAADGSCGAWQGVFSPVDNCIDDSVPEPEFEDEE
jgi:hypothetical protein